MPLPLFGRRKAAAPPAEPAPAAGAGPDPAPAHAAPLPDWTVGCAVKLQTTVDKVCEREGGWGAGGGEIASAGAARRGRPAAHALPSPQDPVSGTVFAFDPATRTLVLKSPGSAPFNSRLRLLAESAVTAVLEASPPAADAADPPLPPLDPAKCRDRLDRAVAAATAAAAKIGVGVSARAQAAFDALDRTMPCAWDGDVVVVLGEVRLAPPYAVDGGVPANPADTETLARVRMVLEAEASKLPPA